MVSIVCSGRDWAAGIADHGREEHDGVDVAERIDDGLDIAEVALDDVQPLVAFERGERAPAVDEAVEDPDRAARLQELPDEDAAEVSGPADDQDVPVGDRPGRRGFGGDGGDLLPDLLQPEGPDEAMLGVHDRADLEVPHLHVAGDLGQEAPVRGPAFRDPERVEGELGREARRGVGSREDHPAELLDRDLAEILVARVDDEPGRAAPELDLADGLLDGREDGDDGSVVLHFRAAFSSSAA